jgi:TolB-like protein/DNA-binding winged helix-turn-helix (wHTH) protein
MNFSAREQFVYVFGPFRLDPVRRALLRDGVAVDLAPRLFDALLCLVENAGRIVARDTLVRAVWDGRIIDEANVKQTIFSLRKALETSGSADRLIVTAPMRGYRFAAPVRMEVDPVAQVPVAAPDAPGNGWRVLPNAIGRIAALALIAIAGAALGVWALLPRQTATATTAHFTPPPHSVAVLAFTSLGDDPRQDYFSDGVSEELISALSRIDALRVAARTSAFSFKGKEVTVADIARQLNVGTVLEGSVRRDGTRVRVTADLVDARTGYELWSGSYDRARGDMLGVQADIAAAVTASLRVTLLGGDAAKFSVGGTDNPRAFDAYLRGMKLQDSPDPNAAKAALAAFDGAIALDPNFALARAHRSHVLNVTASSGDIADPAAVTRMLMEARAEAERAIAIAPNLGGGHVARGSVLMTTLDFAGAEREITFARDLAPGDATVGMIYAFMQLQFGRVQAGLDAAELAASLDPLTQDTYLELATMLAVARRYDDARAALRHAAILGDAQRTRDIEATIDLDQGDFAAAHHMCASGQSAADLICLAIAEHGLGRHAEAKSRMAALRAMLGDTGALQYAEINAQWGQDAEALRWLGVAYRLRDPGLAEMRVDALLGPIRATKEFQDIEARLNFPP